MCAIKKYETENHSENQLRTTVRQTIL